ncbi:MAG: NAD(P)/FAD-dependent oxidoreductase, partial [Hyphomicrobiales bacterium]
MTFPDIDRLPEGKTAAIVGGGPAGLIAAEVLARAGVAVTVYDQMPSLGRKFLMAGRGGLNLTHSEELPLFLARYGDIDPLLRRAIEEFPPSAMRAWSDGLGQATFVGSSGRIFPETLKTSPLLRTWLLRLGNLGVKTKLRHRWDGFDGDGNLRFVADGKDVSVVPDVIILALGGASWAKLGSDGRWAD